MSEKRRVNRDAPAQDGGYAKDSGYAQDGSPADKSGRGNRGSFARDVRLVALDLDGTLLTEEKTVTPRTMETLLRAKARGILPAVVTGRPVSGIPAELTESGVIRYAVTSNGAVLHDLAEQKKIASFLLSGEKVREILSAFQDSEPIYDIVMDGFGYSDPASHEKLLRKYADTAVFPYITSTRRAAEGRSAVLQMAERAGAENVWIMPDSEKMREAILERLRKISGIYLMRTGHRDLEMTQERAGKGRALRVLLKQLGIPASECLAVGDDGNDLDLFDAAGISAAMGNASEEVKRAADFTVSDNAHDGAAEAVARICGL